MGEEHGLGLTVACYNDDKRPRGKWGAYNELVHRTCRSHANAHGFSDGAQASGVSQKGSSSPGEVSLHGRKVLAAAVSQPAEEAEGVRRHADAKEIPEMVHDRERGEG